MAMRIKQNPTALTTLRHSNNAMERVKAGVEQLSSGMKINKGADGPASLIASERLRGRIVGLQQAYNNASASVTLMQTAEGALNEVSEVLIRLKQLSVHAANEAVNDPEMLNADQMEIEYLLDTLDRIAKNTQFNSKTLLDGSLGANGITIGNNLRFVSAREDTPYSPIDGWPVDIHQVATRAQLKGMTPIDVNNIREGLHIVISEGGKNAEIHTDKGQMGKELQKVFENHDLDPKRFDYATTSQTIREIVAYNLAQAIEENGLNVHSFLTPDSRIIIKHNEYGDHTNFSATSSVAGIVSDDANIAKLAAKGRDVEGIINGEVAQGEGQFLTALDGSSARGVSVQYMREIGLKEVPVIDERGIEIGKEFVEESNDEIVGTPDSGQSEGYVHVSQRSQTFQIGPDGHLDPLFSFMNVKAQELGRGSENKSGFDSLADIDVTALQGAYDASMVVDNVIDQVSEFRGRLGAFQRNAIENNLESLKIAEENITQAESTIRDTDMAEAMSQLTSDQIMLQASVAMIGQANQVPKTVLNLIESG